MIGKVFMGIIAVFLLLGAFASPINDGIKSWRTSDTTETFLITTAAGVTSANVTLGHDLYQYATSEVEDFSSNETGDTPVADSYVSATKILLVTGLDSSKTRSLEVNYYAETDSTVMRVIGPFLSILIFGGLLFGIIWSIFGGKRGR